MLKHYSKFKLFLIVAAIFVGAALFLSNPFSHNNTDSAANTAGFGTGTVETVTIEDEAVALGIPGPAKTAEANWSVIGIAITAVCVSGALVVIFISGEEKA